MPPKTIQQIIQQMNSQPMNVVRTPPKPIFIMRVPYQMSNAELDRLRDDISKDGISDDYHILVIPSDVNEYKFEMYNADKIETQKWNDIVNKILK
jgi:hypothetical protein